MDQQGLYYADNYLVFSELMKTGRMTIHTTNITKQNWRDYYTGLDNILKDGIERPEVQQMQIKIIFVDGIDIELSIFDLLLNIIFWNILIKCNIPISSRYLFWGDAITQDTIKSYLDMIIGDIRENLTAKELNNALADTLHMIPELVNKFSMYLSNTINLFDTIKLENACPEFDACMHTSLRNTPIELVKDEGLRIAERTIELIKDSEKYLGYDHCLRNPFIAEQGINKRQYKEFAIHIGTKPNGTGGVHPAIIDKSYLEGMDSIQEIYMDSSAARVAQIQAKKNVGTSGDMARILGINNMDTYLNPDLSYKCQTRNFITITLTDKKVFNRFIDRYYRFNEDDVDHLLTEKDTYLIGKTLLFRSPITCASAAHGHGICAACYGKLALTNFNISVGKFAAEQLSSQLTQILLSAKHLLETVISKMEWTPEFEQYFVIDINGIYANPDFNNAEILIDPDNIFSVADNDEYTNGSGDYDSYITEFTLVDKKGTHIIKSKDNTELYFDMESFIPYMNRFGKLNEDGMIQMSLKDIASKEIRLFLIIIDNNELAKTLKDIEKLINVKPSIAVHDKNTLIQELINLCIRGRITIQSVHLEVIIMNQIRSIVSAIRKPNWENEDEDYTILTLDQALKDNPSIIISLLYQNLSYMLTYPLSYQKESASCMDPFFMLQPQKMLLDEDTIIDPDKKEMINPIIKMPGFKEPK